MEFEKSLVTVSKKVCGEGGKGGFGVYIHRENREKKRERERVKVK